ncbi:MAG: hypothetical protein KKB21_03260 [Nanoarchaeota archaeon]|nr:hypothetical protein [Nanoarchaeota archaeon]MBU4086569.1 hypothetical protein [Nanoarchaeota archaeon]
MNLKKKKNLAARTFGVGAGRIMFRNERIDEIKEAITKQDMRDLMSSNAIMIKDVNGRRKIKKRNRRRGAGKIKKKIRLRKEVYKNVTRKLRAFARQLNLQGRITKEYHKELRKKIKSRIFRSKAHMSEMIKDTLKPWAKNVEKMESTKKSGKKIDGESK